MIALCHDCKHQHALRPNNAPQDWLDWQVKHARHQVDLVAAPFAAKPRNAAAGYQHNANVNSAYANYATVTITLASLGSSSTFVAGREATAIDNSTNKYPELKVSGKITVGTTPTVNTQILVYVLERLNNTPTWPDVFTGSDAAATLTSAGVGRGFLKLGATLDVDSTTSNRAYPFTFRIARLFDGVAPDFFSVFVTHNTGVNLNSTGSNHVIEVQGEYFTVA